ncbi:MAG: hypothetical protein ACYDC0_16890 [Acidimicrobiales bacterium]
MTTETELDRLRREADAAQAAYEAYAAWKDAKREATESASEASFADDVTRLMVRIFSTMSTEQAHITGDEVLLHIAREHGYGDAADVYEQAKKWYA